MGKKREKSASQGERTLYFKRARWKHWVRYIAFFSVTTLNVAMIHTSINAHLIRHIHTPLGRELLGYLIMLFFDVTILLPVLLEVDAVWATSDKITLKTLFWRSKVPWSEIRSFINPAWLTFAVLKTRRCAYLINKRDIKPIDELLETITFKLSKTAP